MSMFRKPSTKRRVGLKVLVTGATGTGKSIFGLTFPKLMALDSEAGLALYEGDAKKAKNLLGIANTQSFKELESAIKEINKEVKKSDHGIGSLLIDSESKFYQNIQETLLTVEEKKAIKNGRDVLDSNISIRSWGKIKQISTKLQNMKIDLSSKGINVISVSQVEDVKEKQGDTFVKVGEKPVASKNIEYDYDIIINLFTVEVDGKTIYKGEIRKDRTGKTQVGDIIENPTYMIWAEDNEKGEIIESDFQSDVEKDIESTEKENDDNQPAVENKDAIIDEIKKVGKQNKKMDDVKAFLKEKGKKITELEVEELNELLEKIK